MNVIIANKYQSMLQTLDIDIIKTMYGEFEVDEIISAFQNFYFQRMILDITSIKNYQDITTLQKLSISLDMDKVILLLDDTPDSGSTDYLSKLISMGIYNFTKNVEGIMYLYNNPNSYRDVAHIHQLDTTKEVIIEHYNEVERAGARIIGIKNVTKNSGATTLAYMMKRQLEDNYTVAAIEVDKRDFSYFNDKNLVSTTNNEIGNAIAKNMDKEVLIIDINDSQAAEGICQQVIYLIEPSVIKLNRLMTLTPSILKKLKDKKVILNQSVLSKKDVLDFEYESKLKVFYNLPPLDDREKTSMPLNLFLVRLGFERQQSDELEKKNKILGIFSF